MDLLGEVEEAIEVHTLLGQFYIASMVFVFYDYLLTARQEVKYVWFVAWTPGKLLFLVIRYLPFIDISFAIYEVLTLTPTAQTCYLALYWIQCSSLIACVLADIVIGLRTWAIWDRSKTCCACIGAAWLGATAAATYYQAGAWKGNTFIPPFFGLTGCLFVSTDSQPLSAVYLIYGLYQTVIFVATVVRGIQHLRNNPVKLMTILYRDAFVSSFSLFALAVANIILLHTAPNWSYGLTTVYRAVNAVLPGRIILNLREAALNVNGWDVTTADPMVDQGYAMGSNGGGYSRKSPVHVRDV